MNLSERNAVFVFSGRILSAVIGILFILVVPRVLGPEGYGYYSFWFSQLFLLFTFFDFGSSELITRYLPDLIAGRSSKSKVLINKVLLLKILLVPPVFLVAFFYQDISTFTVIFVASAIASFSMIFSDVNFAANRMARYSLYHILRKVMRFTLLLSLFFLLGKQGIIGALLGTEIIVFCLFLMWTSSIFPKTPAEPLSKSFSYYLYFGILIFFSNLLFLAVGRLPVIIAKLKGFTFGEIGYFALVLDICYFALRELFYGISESLLPIQAVDHSEGRFSKLANSFRLAITYTLVLIIPCLFLLAVYSEYVIQLIGKSYLPALPLFLLFLPLVAFGVLTFIYRQVLIIFEQKNIVFVINVLSFICFLALALIPKDITLIRLAGAILVAAAANLVLTWLASRRFIKIEKEFATYGKLAFASVLYYLILTFCVKLPAQLEPLGILVGVGIYLSSLFAMKVLGPNEIHLASRLLKRVIP